jgi:NTP pyrophosphatase (non-canonical NTP hydrolase)
VIQPASSLEEFQDLNKQIYLVVNDRSYDNMAMFFRLLYHLNRVLKAVRKNDYKDIVYHLCMSLSWSFAMGNRFHVNLADEMWKSFPGCCPYCCAVPCSCKKRRAKERKNMAGKSRCCRPFCLRDWQEMFARIYPNEIQYSAMHLAEEAGEVGQAMRIHSATHQSEWLREIIEELVDVITNIFGVANCRKIDLAKGMVAYFKSGCPGCNKFPCECSYALDDQPLHLAST